MATEKKITSRIQQKHDVAANWAKATNFIPKKGEIIIYEAEYNASGEETQAVRFKIGDGSKTVNNLPFAVIDYGSDIETLDQKVTNNSNEISKIKDGSTQVASAKISESAFLLLNSLKIIGRETVGAGDNENEYNGRLPVVIRFDQDSFRKYVNSVSSSVIELRNTGVTSGTYNNVTVDLKGRVTKGESKNYALTSDIPDVSGKQDKLTAGSNITISGNTISATIPTDYVKYTAQTLTTAQKTQARSNIGAGTSSFSGSYNDLTNKPTIPDISGKANLSGGNTFTGKQTLNSPSSDGYSINAAGYIKGSWLQASVVSNKGANTGKVCVFDDNGWIYYRTPAEILTEADGLPKSAFSLSGTVLTITL